jgi:hypothetical protein
VRLPHVDWSRVLDADLAHAPRFTVASGYERITLPDGLQVGACFCTLGMFFCVLWHVVWQVLWLHCKQDALVAALYVRCMLLPMA